MQDLCQCMLNIFEGARSAHDKFVETGKIKEPIYAQLKEMDPTPTKKYLEWMCAQVVAGAKPEDLSVVAHFDSMVTKGEVKVRDINQYKTLEDLRKAVEEVSVEGKEYAPGQKVEGADILFDNNKVTGYRINTIEASKELGGGTKWCISAVNNCQFTQYHQGRVSNIYFFIPKGKWKKKYGKIAVLASINSGTSFYGQADDENKKYKAALVDMGVPAEDL